LFQKGYAAFEHGNIDYAIELLSTCVAQEPSLLRARKFLRAAQTQKARQAKGGLGKMFSSFSVQPAVMSISNLAKTGKADRALIEAEKLLSKDPFNMKIVMAFVESATAANIPEAAIMTLEAAREQNAKDTALLNALGQLYQQTGETKKARECFEIVVEINPNDPAALKTLKDSMAMDSMKQGGWQDAKQKGASFRDVMKNANEAALIDQENKSVRSEQDTDALIADHVAKIAKEPNNINYYRALARLYTQKDMYGEAVEILQKAIELSPNDAELERSLTGVYLKYYDFEINRLNEAGDAEGAAAKQAEKNEFAYQDVQDRVSRYPNDYGLRHEYGVMLYERGLIKEAIQQFQLAQRNPKNRVMSMYYVGLCFKSKGQYDLALEQLEKAASENQLMDDTRKEICYEIGEVAMAMGNKQKAGEWYKLVYQVDIGFKDVAARVEQLYSTPET